VEVNIILVSMAEERNSREAVLVIGKSSDGSILGQIKDTLSISHIK